MTGADSETGTSFPEVTNDKPFTIFEKKVIGWVLEKKNIDGLSFFVFRHSV